ncbi:MAG: hypothetical protein N3A72_08800 [bacterium]|nr:hypothetical protein [bacterium]
MKVCKQCKAVLINQRWIPSKHLRNVVYILCPTCKKEEKIKVQKSLISTVFLDGEFVKHHQKYSLALIYRIEKQVRKTETSSRIIEVNLNPAQNGMVIKTNQPKLAIEIAKQFKRRYRGKIMFWSTGSGGVIVQWITPPGYANPVELNAENSPAFAA